jgi:tetratricopeptide (TPR) repeat protein
VRSSLIVTSSAAWIGSAALGGDGGQTPPVADAALREGTGRIAQALAALPAEIEGDARSSSTPLLRLALFQNHTGDTSGARATLRLAQDSARRLEDPYSRINRLALVARAWAKAGDADAARALAREADDQLRAAEGLSATNRANNLMMIASVYEALDDEHEVREVLRRMRAVVAEAPAVERQSAFGQLLMTTVRTGQLDAALGLALLPPFDLTAPQAPGIRVSDPLTSQLTMIARSLHPDNGAEGVELLHRMRRLLPEGEGDSPLSETADLQNLRSSIAAAHAELGDFAGAMKTIDAIPDDVQKARALLGLARNQLNEGDRDAARALAQEAIGRAEHSQGPRVFDNTFLALLAEIQARLGDIDGLMATVQRSDASVMVSCIRQAASAARERESVGDKDGASRLREVVRELIQRRRGLPIARDGQASLTPELREDYGRADLVLCAAELGDFEEAHRLAKLIEDDSPAKNAALGWIAAVQGQNCEVAGALAWIEAIPKPDLRRAALQGLVAGLLEQAGGRAILSKM